MSNSKQVVTGDVEALKALARDTLKALAMFAEPPYHFVQPGMFIMFIRKKHTNVIKEHNLI